MVPCVIHPLVLCLSCACLQGSVERALKFGPAAATGFARVPDEWLETVDNTFMPFDETAIRLELDACFCAAPPPAYASDDAYRSNRPESIMNATNLGEVPKNWLLTDVPVLSCVPVMMDDDNDDDDVLPPEARPPWEKAATVCSTLVTCESLLPSPVPRTEANVASPLLPPSPPLPPRPPPPRRSYTRKLRSRS